MDKDKKATEANAPAIAPKEEPKAAVQQQEADLEARVKELEAEKAKIIEESANYRLAYLKADKKSKTVTPVEDEDDEERMRRIANETIANSRLADIAREQDEIIKRALKENSELKKAHLNRVQGVPTAIGTHTEGQVVQDTSVTPEQVAAFKARGWDDKKIERYKKNLQKNIR